MILELSLPGGLDQSDAPSLGESGHHMDSKYWEQKQSKCTLMGTSGAE